MTTTVQHILVVIVVIAAMAFAARAIYRALRCRKHAPVGCAGCPLADTCRKDGERGRSKGEGANHPTSN